MARKIALLTILACACAHEVVKPAAQAAKPAPPPRLFDVPAAILHKEARELMATGQWDAAKALGLRRSFVLRQIVLPAIRPVVAIAVLIRGLDLFRVFDIIWALTEGGPGSMTETISLYTYVIGFVQFDTSYTAAMAFLVVAVLSIIVTYALRRTELVR